MRNSARFAVFQPFHMHLHRNALRLSEKSQHPARPKG
jgi:hypothetical protein